MSKRSAMEMHVDETGRAPIKKTKLSGAQSDETLSLEEQLELALGFINSSGYSCKAPPALRRILESREDYTGAIAAEGAVPKRIHGARGEVVQWVVDPSHEEWQERQREADVVGEDHLQDPAEIAVRIQQKIRKSYAPVARRMTSESPRTWFKNHEYDWEERLEHQDPYLTWRDLSEVQTDNLQAIRRLAERPEANALAQAYECVFCLQRLTSSLNFFDDGKTGGGPSEVDKEADELLSSLIRRRRAKGETWDYTGDLEKLEETAYWLSPFDDYETGFYRHSRELLHAIVSRNAHVGTLLEQEKGLQLHEPFEAVVSQPFVDNHAKSLSTPTNEFVNAMIEHEKEMRVDTPMEQGTWYHTRT